MSKLLTLIILVALLTNSSSLSMFKSIQLSHVWKEGAWTRTSDCKNPSEYSFLVVENPKRRDAADSHTPEDLNVLIGAEVLAKIELPKESEAKNFSMNSVERTNVGFAIKVDWGGGVYHYEIEYRFRCKEKNLYLYQVTRKSFSTKNRDSGTFLDIKRTKVIKIEPNLPIEEFVMTDYLQ